MSSVTRRDYYEILGVERECDDGVLKTAYRKLAMQYHPDRNPGSHEAEEKFKEAAEAYSVLSDPQKRAAYNRFGHQGVPTAAGNGGFDASGFPDLGDILSDVFGFGDVFGRGGRNRSERGRSAAKTSGTTWKSGSKIRCAGCRWIFRFRAWKLAGDATAKGPSLTTGW